MVDQESWDLRCWLQPVRHRARTATEPGGGLERCLDTKKLCEKYIENMWVFPKIVVPQNGWFIMEVPIKMDDLGVPLFSETPMWL